MTGTFELSFPGLGWLEMTINSIAFTIGENFTVMWYGIMIAIGMLLAITYASWRCKQMGIKVDDLMDIAIYTIFFGVVGARLYYVVFDDRGSFKTFMDIINIRRGGLAIYGGIIFGALTIAIVCLIKKISWRKLFDCAAPGVMIAQAMGRWGNFFNGEAYGGVTDLPWRMCSDKFVTELKKNTNIVLTDEQLVGLQDGSLGVHPTFLYESLWNILGFVIINLLFKKKKFDGQIALYYFAWYGFGRMFIEGLRTDSLYIPGTGIRVSQFLGFLLFALATALIIYGLVMTNKKEKALASANGNSVVNNEVENEEISTNEEATEGVESSADEEENG